MKKKEFKIEYLVYLYVIISPFLDALSCMFRIWFPNALLSPLMVIRPIIPGILLLYIFARDKSVRKPLILSGIGYLLYGVIHLLIFKKLLTGLSYGTIFQEGLYLFNYTYMIYVLFIIMYFSKREQLPHLKKALLSILVIESGMIVFLHPATNELLFVSIIALQLFRESYAGLPDATTMLVNPEQL